MCKKKLFKIIGFIVALFVVIFIIPIIINECYKLNCGYITMWSAADMLSFYGILLESVASVFLLAITIAYNRKQIVYEKNLQQQQERYRDIEKIFNQALDNIHPLEIQNIIGDAAKASSTELLYIQLTMYEAKAKAAVDQLRLSINENDYKELNALANKISEVMEEFVRIKNSYIEFFYDSLLSKMALQIMKNEEGSSKLTQLCFLQFISECKEKSKEICDRLLKIYDEKYQPLIQQKKEVFKQINEQILFDSKKMLHFKF